MKWYDIEQNSPEWDELRAGRLTASNFATIMVNQPKSFNDAAKRLAVQIAFERINGHSMRSHYGDGYSNADIDAQIESLSTEADRNKRNATIARIWEATKQARFYIPLHDQMITSAARRGIEVPLHPNNITYFKFVTVQGPTRQ